LPFSPFSASLILKVPVENRGEGKEKEGKEWAQIMVFQDKDKKSSCTPPFLFFFITFLFGGLEKKGKKK